MLTVRNAERDKVIALNTGARYVVKPFGIEELLAQIGSAAVRARIPTFNGEDLTN